MIGVNYTPILILLFCSLVSKYPMAFPFFDFIPLCQCSYADVTISKMTLSVGVQTCLG